MAIDPELYKRLQQGVGFTDEEMAMVMADPHRRRVMEAGPLLVRRKMVAEVIEAKNCVAHSKGARYVVRANAVIRKEDVTDNMCLDALGVLSRLGPVIMDRIAQGQDPKGTFEYYVHCPDVGVECGGFGRVLFKVTVE